MRAEAVISHPVDRKHRGDDSNHEWQVWVRRSRHALDLTQAALASRAGVGRGLVQAIEAGNAARVADVNLILVSRALFAFAEERGVRLERSPGDPEEPTGVIPEDVHYDILMDLATAPSPEDIELERKRKNAAFRRSKFEDEVRKRVRSRQAPKELVGIGGGKIAVIGTVPGGPTAIRYQWNEATPADGFESIDRGSLPENGVFFAVRVDGESMAPSLKDGDVIVCTPMPRYEDVDPKRLDGKVVVVQFTEESEHQGETTLARWRVVDSQVLLTKDNPRFAPVSYPDGGVHGVAVVVELRRKGGHL